MFITRAPLSLLSYYVQEQENIIPSIHKIDNEKELIDILRLGDPISPSLNIISYKGNYISNPQVSIFNTVYLSLDEKDYKSWEYLLQEYSWIKPLNLHPEYYKKKLQNYSYLFEPDAYDYFWNKYMLYPKKLDAELLILLLKNSKIKSKFTITDLLFSSENDSNTFLYICKNLGSVNIRQELFNFSESKLFQLFIGTEKKPSYIYYFLVGTTKREGNYPELYQSIEILKEAVLNKFIPINTGAVLLNQWISKLEKIKVNYNKFTYKITYQELNQLEILLKGF